MKSIGAGDYELTLKIKTKTGESITIVGDKLAGLIYREGIHCPSIECDFGLVDTSEQNLMQKIIVGEEVDLTFRTKEGADITTKLKIYDIMGGGRDGDKSSQIVKCMSPEAWKSLHIRIENLYEEKKPDEIIQDILKTHLGSSKTITTGLEAEPLTLSTMRDKPYTFISKVCNNSIPSVTKQKGAGKGTAGYVFYETSTGYHFKAFDELMGAESDAGNYAPTTSAIKGDKSVETYFVNVAVNTDGTGDENEQRIVQNYSVKENNNIESQANKGGRVNLIGFFDPDSLRYSEEIYSLKGENAKAMGSLAKGNRENPNIDNDDYSDKPTRIMTKIYSNEMYEGEKSRASEERYNKIKQSLAQRLVRTVLANSQKVEINIPGNSSLHAGDKIILQVYKSQSNTDSKKQDRVDKKMSGYYLISKVAHKFDKNIATTTCLLVRDQNNEPDS